MPRSHIGNRDYDRMTSLPESSQSSSSLSSQSSKTTSSFVSDADLISAEYRFLRTAADNDDSTEEKRLARIYHQRLYKEYVIADLSKAREGKIGLRWRTEKEVRFIFS